jgi:hypothetical protein
MIHEIKFTDWPAFCQRLGEHRAGATVKLETINLNGIRTEVVASAEFQSFVFSKVDACSDLIIVRLKNHSLIVHEIFDPFRITLHSTDGSGDFNPLQIAAENGITILTLHPAIHAQMLV